MDNNEPSAKFFALYMQDRIPASAIDDYVGVWHRGHIDNIPQLHDYLGMTSKEYWIWVKDPEALPKIRKKRIDTISKYEEFIAEARAKNPDVPIEHILESADHLYEHIEEIIKKYGPGIPSELIIQETNNT